MPVHFFSGCMKFLVDNEINKEELQMLIPKNEYSFEEKKCTIVVSKQFFFVHKHKWQQLEPTVVVSTMNDEKWQHN